MPRHCLRGLAMALGGSLISLLAFAGCRTAADREADKTSDEVLQRMEAGLDPAKAADPPADAPAALASAAAPKPPAAASSPPSPRPPSGALPPPPPAPKPEVKKGDVRLSLLDAIRHALANNHDIQIAAYEPPLLQSDVTKAWGVFDPTAFMTNQNSRVDRPTQTTIDTGSSKITDLVEHHWQNQYGIRQKMLSGGTVSLYQEQNYLKSDSLLVTPNPQYTTDFNAELKQPLLKGAGDLVNQAPIRVANLNAGIGFQEFRQKTMEAINDTVSSYWQLVFDMETLAVAQRTVDLAQEVLRREDVRRKDGVSNELSVNRAQAAVATRQAEVVRNQTRIQNSADKLKLLMNSPEIPLDADVRVLPTEKPTYYVFEVDRSAAVAKALINRPEIESARVAVAINQIRADVAHHEKMPRLDALLRYTTNGLATRLGESYEGQGTFDQTGWVAGLELEMPLPNRDAKGDWRRRLIEYQQSLLQADQKAAKAIQEVNLAVRMILAARDEVEATLKAKSAAELTVKGEFARFELGQTSNYELLQSQDTLGSAEREYLQALLNFNLALTELSRAQGTLLDDRGVEVIWPEGRHSHIMPLRVQLNQATPKPASPPSAAAGPEDQKSAPVAAEKSEKLPSAPAMATPPDSPAAASATARDKGTQPPATEPSQAVPPAAAKATPPDSQAAAPATARDKGTQPAATGPSRAVPPAATMATPPEAPAPALAAASREIRVDESAHRVLFPIATSSPEGVVDRLITQKPRRAGQSVFVTPCSAAELAKAFKRAGFPEGQPPARDGEGGLRPPAGPAVEIAVITRDKDGRETRLPASVYLSQGPDGTPLSQGRWVWVGPQVLRDGDARFLLPELSGSLVTTDLGDTTAMAYWLGRADPAEANARAYRTSTTPRPPPGAVVDVEVRLVPTSVAAP